MKRTTGSNLVLLEVEEDGVAIVTLNRPEVLNAINIQLARMLIAILEEVADRADVRVVILTGQGDRAFSSGGDLKARHQQSAFTWASEHREFERMHQLLRTMPKPLIAAVNGVAVAGGCEIAMNCDFIVASENARFGQPEVSRGIQAGGGATQSLPRRIPLGMAMELLMTGRLMSAGEAKSLGLVNHVYPSNRLLDAARELAKGIAANSSVAVQSVKRVARLGLDLPLERGLEIELEGHRQLVDHPDRHEGIAAFNEHREPRFPSALPAEASPSDA